MRKGRGVVSYANVVSTLALISAVGGGAYAAVRTIPDRSGVFHGCVNKRTGALRVVASASSCQAGKHGKRATEFAIAWNQQGQTGLVGPRGQQGIPGQPGTPGTPGTAGTARAYALVARTTFGSPVTFTHALGVASIINPSDGVYCITLANGVDGSTTGAVVTPDYFSDTTFPGTNGSQAWVEYYSHTPTGCSASQIALMTGTRSVTTSAGNVTDVHLTQTNEGFFFAVP